MTHAFRLLALLLACATLSGLAGSVLRANAQETEQAMEAAPSESAGVLHTSMIVEGRSLHVRQTYTEAGELLIDAAPVFEALRGRVTLEGTVLRVDRFQDGARLSIDMADGKVRSNATILGRLPDWDPRETADTWLTLNAIAVITGTHVTETQNGLVELTLDDRLRPQFDLDLFVQGERLAFVEAEPRTIGPVLLVPLRDIAEALGHEVESDPQAGSVTVTRSQDSAQFTLDLATGLVSVNGEPRGITANMSYIERDSLLLPFSAVETLTGTHITLQPGTNRIDVVLDDRLADTAMPGESVAGEAEGTGLTLERLSFQATDTAANRAVLNSRFRGFNMITEYETAGGLTETRGLQPSWLATEVRALAGWRATIGDASPQLRQLAGADVSRIRGVTFRTRRESGSILALAAGSPLIGSSGNETGINTPEFGGFAAGARLIKPQQGREIGIAAVRDEDGETGQLVVSIQQDLVTEAGKSDDIGLQRIYVSADAGAFSGGNVDLDVRAQVNGAYKLSETANLRASLSHEGGGFRPPARNSEPTPEFGGVYDERVGSRSQGNLSLDWRAVEDWGAFTQIGGGVRISHSRQGEVASSGIGAAISGRLPHSNIDLSMDVGLSVSPNAETGANETSTVINMRAIKRFGWGAAQANLTSAQDQAGEQFTRLVANLTVEPVSRQLGNGAFISLAPSASAVIDQTTQSARFGATAQASSGAAFGDRFRMRGQVSALQSVDPDNARTAFFANVTAQYDIFRNVRLEAAWNDNFDGASSLAIGLRGAITFNEPRRHTRPVDGAGVLRGQAFYDRNRDGVRQPDEPGVPGVRVGIRNSRLSLNVDYNGNYTIQNLPTGLYSVSIDRRSLPLGLLVPDDLTLRATIADGRITVLDIPVIASGQLRGAAFVDLNGNGSADPGEPRLEGAQLRISRLDEEGFEPVEQVAASFGQYGFENLVPGTYLIEARYGGERISRTVTIENQNLFGQLPLDFPPAEEPAPEMVEDGVSFTA